MQKCKLLIMLLAVTLSMTGCTTSVKKNNDKLSVVTLIFSSYDFVKQIAGDEVDVKLLIKPGMDMHSYEPTPQDIIAIQECDVFIYTGGENDEWVEDILDSFDTSDMQIIKMLDCVDNLYEEEEKEGMDVHEEEEEEAWDEHVWTSPLNAIKICEEIARVLVDNGINQNIINSNLASYTRGLCELDNDIRNVVSNSQRKILIFGDRFPARYFTEEYGLDYYAAFPGCAAQNEASAATIAFLIDKVKEEKIDAVLKVELSSDNMAKTIANEAGAKVYTFNSGHNVSKKDFENGATYLSIMRDNLQVIKEALN